MSASVTLLSSEPSQDPVLGAPDVLPVAWSDELLTSLDWRRLVEVTRALAVFSGYEPGGTEVDITGAAQFRIANPRQPRAKGALVKLAPWNRWMATADCVASFVELLGRESGLPGIYLAPAGATPGAATSARSAGIELLDAKTLAARLNELPRDYSEYFHDKTVSGLCTVPTCPVCLRPLHRSEEQSVDVSGKGELPDYRYHNHDIVGEPIVARCIEILQGCEVHFLREVRAQDVVVNGVVRGDFVCDGSLLLNPGGVLHGSVAARSVLVRPGGALNGETRILQGPLEPVTRLTIPWIWRCEHMPPQAGCESVAFHPH